MLDWQEVIFRAVLSIFTRTNQINLITRKKNKPVYGDNLIRAIEKALPWKVKDKDKNDIRTTLVYILSIESLWTTHLRPKDTAEGYVVKTMMTKQEVLKQVRSYEYKDIIILNAIATIYNIVIVVIDGV